MNQTAIAFIKIHEGCTLEAYRDSGGVWTIGYGHTGPEVIAGLIWTQAQADIALESDLEKCRVALKAMSLGANFSIETEAALLSFIFNLGSASYLKSTLRILVNQKDWLSAAKEFQKWDNVSGKENKGLLIRRLEEAALLLKGI